MTLDLSDAAILRFRGQKVDEMYTTKQEEA